jgi:hypothetical protein
VERQHKWRLCLCHVGMERVGILTIVPVWRGTHICSGTHRAVGPSARLRPLGAPGILSDQPGSFHRSPMTACTRARLHRGPPNHLPLHALPLVHLFSLCAAGSHGAERPSSQSLIHSVQVMDLHMPAASPWQTRGLKSRASSLVQRTSLLPLSHRFI